MRNKEKTDKRLINSIEEVDITFKLLSDKRQIEELYKGIYILLDKLGSIEVKELFDRYPRLMQKYSIKEMFSGNIEIPDVNPQSLKIAGLLTCLQYLTSSLPEFIDESGHCIPLKESDNSISLQAENYILNSVSLDDYIKEIFLAIVSFTGKEYYQKFSEKIGNPDFTIDDILKLENDIELQEHLDLMAWGYLVRLFLEALYFYFNPENHNPKIQ
ncbi:hypothetical protein SAMN05421856_10574 [Chryseobacterium taichungense]|uniref:Uncharacterized protein n=1 Tax=Chryseobacterium taichungense TaxID=295069 RepID=A0A1H8A2X9_9FLAO|nr:hypothetical protein [Chryseobacterium taichungense]SEM65070.1 hypothetical protein SAMN05421856_10574 [Chryseobacterium taichungense]